MGHVHVEARLFARRQARVRFLVDTGATFTIVSPAIVRRVGAASLPRRFDVSLADGSRRSLLACTMGIEIAGRTAPMTALVLAKSEPLLGVEALEALGLRVNPVSRKLEPARAQAVLLVGVRPAAPRRTRRPD